VEKKRRFVCPLRQKKRLLPKGGADCHAGVAIWLLNNRTPYPILERMRLRAVSAVVYDLAKVLFEFLKFLEFRRLFSRHCFVKKNCQNLTLPDLSF